MQRSVCGDAGGVGAHAGGAVGCMLVMINELTVGLAAQELRLVNKKLHDSMVATLRRLSAASVATGESFGRWRLPCVCK